MQTNQQDTNNDPKPVADILTAIYAPLQYFCTCRQVLSRYLIKHLSENCKQNTVKYMEKHMFLQNFYF